MGKAQLAEQEGGAVGSRGDSFGIRRFLTAIGTPVISADAITAAVFDAAMRSADASSAASDVSSAAANSTLSRCLVGREGDGLMEMPLGVHLPVARMKPRH